MTSLDYYRNGYSCGQAVLLAHGEPLGLPPALAQPIGATLGGGLGGLRQICGAFSALAVLAGLKNGHYDPADTAAKNKFYKFIQHLHNTFEAEMNGSRCHDILKQANCTPSPAAADRDEAYYALRPCERCLVIADELFDTYLKPDDITPAVP